MTVSDQTFKKVKLVSETNTAQGCPEAIRSLTVDQFVSETNPAQGCPEVIRSLTVDQLFTTQDDFRCDSLRIKTPL